MKRENVVSRADLENALHAKGSSLDREKRHLHGQIIAQQWVQEKVETGEEKGRQDRRRSYTRGDAEPGTDAHLADFEQPAKARWEELMISFTRHSNRDEAYAAIASLGNRVLAGASLADVAKSASEGPMARQGGLRDWTHKDTLASESLNQAIFSLPVGQLSQILESPSGFHIVRVVERHELTRTSFLDGKRKSRRTSKRSDSRRRYQKFVEDLHKKYPVWTVFDNAMQEPAKAPDDDDRYSSRK